MEFITSNEPKNKWGSHPDGDSWLQMGWGEWNLGMVTTFCCHNQAKMEASGALSALCQCDSPEPSVGCGEEVHQYSLYPSRVLPSPLSRCEHSFQRCFLHPIPTWTSYIYADCSPSQILRWSWLEEEGEIGIESVSLFLRGSMAKIRRGEPPLWPDLIVSPFVCSSSPSRREHPDGRRIGLSASPQASTRCQSSQS